MISADQALQLILRESVCCQKSQKSSLLEALFGHVSDDLFSPIHLPPFDNSAMDGFAVHSEELSSASVVKPVILNFVECIAAGDVVESMTSSCVRIMTGACVPEGFDAIVPFEKTKSGISPNEVCFFSPILSGENIRRSGEDVQKGERVCLRGDKITSRNISLLAAVGFSEVPVIVKPKVAILSTGSELIEPGVKLPPGKIYNSNGPTLLAACREMGIVAESIGNVEDDPDKILKLLQDRLEASEFDILLTMGGVSAGDFDWIPKVLKELGAQTLFHKIAVKPGKPLLFATIQKSGKKILIFGLPGNPVSSLMVFDRFVRPSLLKMMGAQEDKRVLAQAIVRGKLKGSLGKVDFLRGIVRWEGSHFVAEAAGSQGSARLVPLARANATLILPENVTELCEGQEVSFERW